MDTLYNGFFVRSSVNNFVFPQLSLSKKKTAENYAPLEAGHEAHWEVVERILFLYAKLNPGQGYVQGMNEIIGPIYYAFATDPRQEWRGKCMHAHGVGNDPNK